MVCPREHEAAVPRHTEIVHRLPVSERLTRMVDRRLEIHERLIDETRHRTKRRLREIAPEVFAVGERADAQGIAIRSENRNAFSHMLSRRTAHHGAEPSFQLPR